MKYLYIENGQGFFSVSGLETDKQTIDKIRKEDLLRLLNLIVDESAENGFEMDPYDEETCDLYKSAIEKYSTELSEE